MIVIIIVVKISHLCNYLESGHFPVLLLSKQTGMIVLSVYQKFRRCAFFNSNLEKDLLCITRDFNRDVSKISENKAILKFYIYSANYEP